jgi:hypothetical protein
MGRFLYIFCGQCLYFSSKNTNTHITSRVNESNAIFSLKPYTLAGFEPGSSVPEANVMSTAPRRQGDGAKFIHLGF